MSKGSFFSTEMSWETIHNFSLRLAALTAPDMTFQNIVATKRATIDQARQEGQRELDRPVEILVESLNETQCDAVRSHLAKYKPAGFSVERESMTLHVNTMGDKQKHFRRPLAAAPGGCSVVISSITRNTNVLTDCYRLWIVLSTVMRSLPNDVTRLFFFEVAPKVFLVMSTSQRRMKQLCLEPRYMQVKQEHSRTLRAEIHHYGYGDDQSYTEYYVLPDGEMDGPKYEENYWMGCCDVRVLNYKHGKLL